MDWGARLRAAWRGEVPDADLGAMFAASASLDGLRQALADQRLAAQIEHTTDDWRALLAVGALAAPLWLAETLVALAGAFYDADTQTHPARAGTVSAYTHELVGRLLAPVQDIVAEVTAALADPARRPALTAPLRVGPGGDIADLPLPEPVPEPYWRALAAAARRVHTSASAALGEVQAVVTRPPAPDWLAAGFQRLDGSLKAAGARLDMDEVRLPALAQAHGANPAAPGPLSRDLWMVVDAACVAGQMVADPHLLPEAVAARPAVPGSQAVGAGHDFAQYPPMAPRRERTPPVSLPRIPEGAPASPPQPANHPSAGDEFQHGAPQRDLPLPSIGPKDTPSGAGQSPGGQPAAHPATHPLPAIGGPEPPAAAPPTPPHHDATPPSQRPASDDRDEPPIRLPEIG
jgi:hypothetical protein